MFYHVKIACYHLPVNSSRFLREFTQETNWVYNVRGEWGWDISTFPTIYDSG